MASVLERLGIAEAVKSKVTRPESDIASELVAKGEVELGRVVRRRDLTTPGVDLDDRTRASATVLRHVYCRERELEIASCGQGLNTVHTTRPTTLPASNVIGISVSQIAARTASGSSFEERMYQHSVVASSCREAHNNRLETDLRTRSHCSRAAASQPWRYAEFA